MGFNKHGSNYISDSVHEFLYGLEEKLYTEINTGEMLCRKSFPYVFLTGKYKLSK
jgi:hypothetical protein